MSNGRPWAALLCASLLPGFPGHVDAQAAGGSVPRSTAASKPSSLAPLVVSSKPIGSFGISVRARRDGITGNVAEMTVTGVIPNSDADKEGLGPLTRILRIDGRNVNEIPATFDRGSDLNSKLIDRKQGERITLEVLILGARKPKEVTLVEGRVHEFPNESDSEVEPMRTIRVGFSN
jgi:C-terminal processing protease CtpA/Prc